jgi:hypothetical protein
MKIKILVNEDDRRCGYVADGDARETILGEIDRLAGTAETLGEIRGEPQLLWVREIGGELLIGDPFDDSDDDAVPVTYVGVTR